MPFGPKPLLTRILKYGSQSMTTKTQLTLAGLHMVGLEILANAGVGFWPSESC